MGRRPSHGLNTAARLREGPTGAPPAAPSPRSAAQYYDEDKELRTRDAEAEQRRVKTAQLHADVGTQSVLRSEGHAFNILTAETYHEDKVRRLDEAANARPHVHAEYRHRNAQYVDALEEMYGKKDEAAVRRRQRPERMGAHITQGFDITTGQAFGMSRDEFRLLQA